MEPQGRGISMNIRIFCTLQFEGWHQWEGAPDTIDGVWIGHLRNLHRHLFHVRCEKMVSHTNRDIEFIALKTQVLAAVQSMRHMTEVRRWSCEQWAAHLLNRFKLDRCEVSEDGENGAVAEVVCRGCPEDANAGTQTTTSVQDPSRAVLPGMQG